MRGILIALLIMLPFWAGVVFIGVSLKRAASQGNLPVLHLREAD